MLKRLKTLLMVLAILLVFAVPAAAVDLIWQMQDGGSSGEGDPGSGNWNPRTDDQPELVPIFVSLIRLPGEQVYWVVCIDCYHKADNKLPGKSIESVSRNIKQTGGYNVQR